MAAAHRTLLASLLLLASATLAQSPQSTPSVSQQPGVRVTTHLVQINVVAVGRKGQPVSDLKREDFTLFDEKEEQEIQVFAVEASQAAAANMEPLPTNTFSNHLDQKGTRPGSVTVILFDSLNTHFEDQAYAKQQIVKFLKQIQPGDRVAIYTLGADLRILHDFTTDAAALVRALDRHTARTSRELDASEPQPSDTGNEDLDAFLDNANQVVADFNTVRRVQRTLAAIEAIANHLQAIPGRKNLIWVSSSFPLQIGLDDLTPDTPQRERRSFTQDLDRTMRAVNNANLAIYPVDARGLVGYFGPGGGAAIRRPGIPTFAQTRGNIDTMQTIAERTGGRAFYNTNDITGSIRRAIDDARLTYVLGFYPMHGKWNGKFHHLKVQVKREGVRIRYREGYFALDEPELTPAQGESVMRAAMWNPLDATGIGLQVQATPFESSGSNWLKLVIAAEGSAVALQEEDGRWVGALDYIYVQQREGGEMLASTTHRQGISLTPERYQRLRNQRLVFTRLCEVIPGAELLMLVVRDPRSGALGTVRIPLKKLSPAPGPASN